MTRTGDIWDVTPIPQSQFPDLPSHVFTYAEELLAPWLGKCRDACRLNRQDYQPKGWLNPVTASTANELGAPVGQALRVAILRNRAK